MPDKDSVADQPLLAVEHLGAAHDRSEAERSDVTSSQTVPVMTETTAT